MTSDVDRLRGLLSGLKTTKQRFARDAGIPGGASMLSQHLSGNRPISVEAAIAYARGLGCAVDDVSPEAAKLLRDGAALVASNTKALDTPAPAPALSQALATVLGHLAGLDDYTAGQVLQALRRATEPAPPLERIEADLLRWLERAPPAAEQTKRTGTAG